MEKLPADRFSGAQDFARALDDPGFRHVEVAAAGAAGGSGPWKRLPVLGWSVAALFALAFGWSLRSLSRVEPRPLARFELRLGDDPSFVSVIPSASVALSPDGSQIFYAGAMRDGGTQLWQRALDELDPAPLRGTEGASHPAVSPDGQSVAFEAQGGIKTVSLPGGTTISVVAEGRHPVWGANETIYFVREGVIHRLPAAGGEAEAVTTRTNATNHILPDALPGGDGLLFTLHQGPSSQSRIMVVSTQGGDAREILTGTMARYALSGHIVYTTASGTLMAAPFDADRLDVTGPSVTLLQGLRMNGNEAQFSVSATGTLLYGTGVPGVGEMVWVSRAGVVEPVDPEWSGVFHFPVLSPDGTRLAVTIVSRDSSNIWVKQLDRGPSLRLTFEGSLNRYPSWTPDGSSLTFYSERAGGWDLWTKRADGTLPAMLELDREQDVAESRWSPDGEWLVYRTSIYASLGSGDILALRPGEDTVPLTLVATEFAERAPTLSPNGRWLAYTSDETGRNEIYVVPFPNVSDARIPVSTSGGDEPVWSHSGRELFYRNGQNDLVAVEVETELTFSPGRSSVLFSAAEFWSNSNSHPMYDVTLDDERFVMIRTVGGDVNGRLTVVLNFFEELKARVPN